MADRTSDLESRLAAVERSLQELLGKPRANSSDRSGTATEVDFWALDGLEERHPDGALLVAGSVRVPGLGPVRWQYGKTSEEVVGRAWSELADTLDALGHPVRLTLLQLVLSGVRSTAELAARDELGTTGQLHHHLRALISAGWLSSTSRGHYQIPPTRIVPLAVIILAAGPA